MARVPRKLTVQAGLSVHKVWRGHNKEWNLGTAPQKERYLEFMNQDLESKKYEAGSVLEAVTVMSNHGHEASDVKDQKLYSKSHATSSRPVRPLFSTTQQTVRQSGTR